MITTQTYTPTIISNGFSLDNTPLTGSPILIGAKVVDASTYAPTYTTNSVASFAIDKTSGAVLVSQGNLVATADGVGVWGHDGTNWQAATIISASTAKTGNTQVLMVQPIDANGNVAFNTTVICTSSFTRYTTTTAYVPGQVICNSTGSDAVTNVLSNVVRSSGGSGMILNASLIDSTNAANPGNYEVYIFSNNRTSEYDSASFSASYSDGINLVSVIPFSTSSYYIINSGSNGTVVYTNNNIMQGFVCSPSTSSLYWNLVVRNAYTPKASEQYTLKLRIKQD